MLTRIRLVAWHVFKENVRDRVLYSIVAFAALLVGAALLLGQITAGQDVKIVKDLGLAAIELSGVLIAVFIGVGLVWREIDRRTIYTVLAKPIARWEFLAGKYAGLLLTVLVTTATMTVAFYAVLAVMAWLTPAASQRGWEAPALDPRLLIAVVLIFGELALLTAVALFFSVWSSSALLSIVFTLGLWTAGLFTRELRGFSALVPSGLVAGLTRVLAVVLPAFWAFDVKATVVHGLPVPPGYVLATAGYGVLYIAAVLAAALALFSRREFL